MSQTDKICSYPGCTSKRHAKGLCGKHYKRMKRASEKPKKIWFVHKDLKYQKLVNEWHNLVFGDN
jgi:hypothetical protein